MSRRIWIVTMDTEITQTVIDIALANDCTEIVCGIPPKLISIVIPDDLPCAYEEPVMVPTLTDADVKALEGKAYVNATDISAIVLGLQEATAWDQARQPLADLALVVGRLAEAVGLSPATPVAE